MEGSVFIFVFFLIYSSSFTHLLFINFYIIIVYVFYIHFVNSFFFPCRFQVGPRQTPKAGLAYIFFRCP